jgi:hypothetical protein
LFVNSDPNAPGGTPVMQQTAPVKITYPIFLVLK